MCSASSSSIRSLGCIDPYGASRRYVRAGSFFIAARSGAPIAPSVDGKPRRLIFERRPSISSSSRPFSSRTMRSARSRNAGSM